MPHSFVAYVDESGDQGFVFRDAPRQGSSRWFVLSAVIVRREDDNMVVPFAREARKKLQLPDKAVLHFADMTHERRVAFVHDVAAGAFACISSVIVNKRELASPNVFGRGGFRLYYYTTRLLLERISWYARDYAPRYGERPLTFPANGKVKIIFERCKNLNYEHLKAYIGYLSTKPAGSPYAGLAPGRVTIHWPCIDTNLVQIGDKKKVAGLQLADCVASSLKSGLEQTAYGHTEHRYAKTLKPRTYARGTNFTSYGLKFFPSAPEVHWVRKYYR